MKKIFFVLISSLLVFGCGSSGGSGGSNNAQFSGLSYVEIGSGSLTKSSTSISGTGTIAFVDPLSAVSSGHNFHSTFSLQDGGSIALAGFATNNLDNSVSIRFSRVGSVLNVVLLADGGQTDVSASFASVDASGAISVYVDMHNNESPTHILVWPGSATAFDETTTLFNSEDDGAAPGNGAGTYWGFTLNQATLTQAQVGAAKFEE